MVHAPTLFAGFNGRLALAIVLGLLSHAAIAATLHYDAFVAGIKVGTATVEVRSDSADYSITGSAAVDGVVSVFSSWQSEFYANGRFIDGHPQLTRYGYDERERKKHRVLTIEDNQIREVKNGKPRHPRPGLEGHDVLTAFFIVPDCWETQLVHTGRSSYQIEGSTSRVDGGCQMQVEDDDGDLHKVHIVYAQRQGFVVPVRLTSRRLPGARIVLRTSPLEQASAGPLALRPRPGSSSR